MTEERWQRIADQVAIGDPIKDIEYGPEQIEYELFAYCEELRTLLHLSPPISTGPS
jgi:hypothetical protein